MISKETKIKKQEKTIDKFLTLGAKEDFVIEDCMFGYTLTRNDVKIRIWVKKLH
jgi:hypothetical protein